MNNDLPSTNPEEAMSCFDLSKNDSSLISATGGMISIFYMTTFKTMKKVMPPPPVATCLAFHPRDDSIVGIGLDNSTIVIYNLHSDEVTRNLEGHAKRVTSLSLRPLTSFSFCFQPKVLSLILIEHGIRAPGLIPERGVSCEREVFPEIPKRDKGCSFIVWFTETHIKMVGSGSSGGDLRTPQFDGANYDLRTPQFHVIETLFIDHVCEWQDCNTKFTSKLLLLSQKFICNTRCALSGSSISQCCKEPRYFILVLQVMLLGTAIEVIDYPCLSKKILFPILDEVKSTVTDPGQSHMSTVAIPNGLPTTAALTLNEGSSPMSTDFHPIWQTILLFGTCVGDIGPPWDVSSGVKLLSRNFRVWNLDTGPMALKVHLLLDYALLFQPY
ncbi:unnamed protein product [Prunus armeniaca]